MLCWHGLVALTSSQRRIAVPTMISGLQRYAWKTSSSRRISSYFLVKPLASKASITFQAIPALDAKGLIVEIVELADFLVDFFESALSSSSRRGLRKYHFCTILND